MKKFESPQINVVKFMNDDVITTSSGYGNITDSNFDDLFAPHSAAPANDEVEFWHFNTKSASLKGKLFCYKRRWGFTDK